MILAKRLSFVNSHVDESPPRVSPVTAKHAPEAPRSLLWFNRLLSASVRASARARIASDLFPPPNGKVHDDLAPHRFVQAILALYLIFPNHSAPFFSGKDTKVSSFAS